MNKTLKTFENKQIAKLELVKGGHNGKGTKRSASSASGKPQLL
jgi:hypothetical protein